MGKTGELRRGLVGLTIVCALGGPAWLFFQLAHEFAPFTGGDYSYFVPQLIDTARFMRINGLSNVHWWTPSLGGGLPVFANPQSMQFSLPQLLGVWLPPFRAAVWSLTAYFGLGAIGSYLLGRRGLSLGRLESLFLALTFTINGFALSHLLVGHLSFHAFLLQPMLVWLVLDDRLGESVAVGSLALVGAQFVFSGGYVVGLVGLLGCTMTLLVGMVFSRATLGQMESRRIILACGLALLIASPKLYAIASYMQQFPRIVASESLPTTVHVLLQLIFVPFVGLSRLIADVGSVTSVAQTWFGHRLGVWEYDCFVNPVGLALAVATPRLWWSSSSSKERRRAVTPALAIMVLLVVMISLSSARGPLFRLLKPLPLLHALHVNMRFTGSFVLPVAVAAAIGAQTWLRRMSGLRRAAVGIMLLLSTIVTAWTFSSLYRLDRETWGQTFDTRRSEHFFDQILEDEEQIQECSAVANVNNEDAVIFSMSSLDLYEPLFGYRLEKFARAHDLQVGSVHDVRDGEFNLNFPPAFVFPRYYGIGPFSRIPASDTERFKRFVRYQKVDWPLPFTQRALSWVGVVSVIMAVGAILFGLLVELWRRSEAVRHRSSP